MISNTPFLPALSSSSCVLALMKQAGEAHMVRNWGQPPANCLEGTEPSQQPCEWPGKQVIAPLNLQMRLWFWPTPWLRPFERMKQRTQLRHAQIPDPQKLILFLFMLPSNLRCIPNLKAPELIFSYCSSLQFSKPYTGRTFCYLRCPVLRILRARMSRRTWEDTGRLYSGSVMNGRYR